MKNRLFGILLSFMLLILITVSLFGCKTESTPFDAIDEKLGITVSGGGFDGTHSLVASKVSSPENIAEVTEKLSNMPYNKDAEIFIYYITVKQNNSSVNPSKPIKISLPIPTADYSDYVIFNIFQNEITTVSPTVSDGKISFESHFLQYFVIAHSHIHAYSDWQNKGEIHERACKICGFTQTEAHVLDNGNRINNGIEFSCKECDYKKFEKALVTVTVSLNTKLNEGCEIFKINDESQTTDNRFQKIFFVGETITLYVEPETGYDFQGWYIAGTEEKLSGNQQYEYTVSSYENVFLVAQFKQSDTVIGGPWV